MATVQGYAQLCTSGAAGGIATNAWQSLISATDVPDNAYAYQTSTGNWFDNQYLIASQFGFSIPPGSSITGVSVIYWTYNNENLVSDSIPALVYLTTDATNPTGTNVSSDNTFISDTGPFNPEGQQIFGANSSTWGVSLSVDDVNSDNFGVMMAPSTTATNFIDAVMVEITYVTVTPTPSPTVTPTVTATPTFTPTPSITGSPTITPTQSLTPTRTPSATPSSTTAVTPTLTPTSTVTPSPTATRSLTPTPTLTPTITPTHGGGAVNNIPIWFMTFFRRR